MMATCVRNLPPSPSQKKRKKKCFSDRQECCSGLGISGLDEERSLDKSEERSESSLKDPVDVDWLCIPFSIL